MIKQNKSILKEKIKILIIDDDTGILDLFEELESFYNFKGVRIDDGFKALEILEKDNSFDLIVLDLMLKGIDGFEICRRLKLDHRFFKIPLIMLTANDNPGNQLKGYRVGADGYVTKPFSPDNLFELIDTVVLERKNYMPHSKIDIELGCGIESIKDINRAISTIMATTSISKSEIADLQLCFHEICHNALEHGNKYDEFKRVFISITIDINKVQICVRDQGAGFKLSDILDPTESDNIYKPRGRGIYLTKSLMDTIHVDENTKTVTFEKYISLGITDKGIYGVDSRQNKIY
jgi:DNA-binding response OmpR family regulator